jgi:hypothetical protein
VRIGCAERCAIASKAALRAAVTSAPESIWESDQAESRAAVAAMVRICVIGFQKDRNGLQARPDTCELLGLRRRLPPRIAFFYQRKPNLGLMAAGM